jgi:hypothetical protein
MNLGAGKISSSFPATEHLNRLTKVRVKKKGGGESGADSYKNGDYFLGWT